jgi:hypothetical protein
MDIPLEMCDYNDAQLLDVIDHLLKSFRSLANTLDESRPDVVQVIDAIIDHPDQDVEMDVKQISDSGMIGGKILTLDRSLNKFQALNWETGEVIAEAPAMDLKSLKKKMTKMGMI